MKLYPFQEEGAAWLVGETKYRRLYLADEMGLGKTVQVIVAARMLGVEHILIMCPAAAIAGWRQHFNEWWPNKQVAIISYARLLRHWRRVGGAEWDLVVLDEAHYVKNVSAKRTLRALQIAAAAKRAWLVSGTPAPNSDPTELWPPVKHLWPSFAQQFGITRKVQWVDAFCETVPTLYGPKVVGVKNGSKLKELLDRVMLRRTWREVGLDLPPLRVDVQYFEHDPKFQSSIEAMVEEAGGVEYVMEATSDDPHVSRLRHYLGAYKAPRAADMIARELRDRQYQKIVVLGYHRRVLQELWKHLEPFGCVTLDGSTPKRVRDHNVAAFQQYTDCRVFLGQITAAGVSLNLQVAHEVALVEPPWSPGDLVQAVKRIHRIGQDQPCRARLFAVPDTLDDNIMGTLARKARMKLEAGL